MDQVAALADVFERARTVEDAIKALEAWALQEDKSYTDEAKAFFYGTVHWKPDPGGSRGHSGKQLRALSRSGLDAKFAGRMAVSLYGRDENTPSDTSRNKQLVRPRFDRVERDGKDHRAGRNISAEELASASICGA